jgi:hypothetical protein
LDYGPLRIDHPASEGSSCFLLAEDITSSGKQQDDAHDRDNHPSAPCHFHFFSSYGLSVSMDTNALQEYVYNINTYT